MLSLRTAHDTEPEIRRWSVDKQERRNGGYVVRSAEQEEDVRGVVREVCEGFWYDWTCRIPVIAVETPQNPIPPLDFEE